MLTKVTNIPRIISPFEKGRQEGFNKDKRLIGIKGEVQKQVEPLLRQIERLEPTLREIEGLRSVLQGIEKLEPILREIIKMKPTLKEMQELEPILEIMTSQMAVQQAEIHKLVVSMQQDYVEYREKVDKIKQEMARYGF